VLHFWVSLVLLFVVFNKEDTTLPVCVKPIREGFNLRIGAGFEEVTSKSRRHGEENRFHDSTVEKLGTYLENPVLYRG